MNKVFEIVSCCDHSETCVWFTVVPQQLKSEVYGDTFEDCPRFLRMPVSELVSPISKNLTVRVRPSLTKVNTKGSR